MVCNRSEKKELRSRRLQAPVHAQLPIFRSLGISLGIGMLLHGASISNFNRKGTERNDCSPLRQTQCKFKSFLYQAPLAAVGDSLKCSSKY